MGSKRAHFGAPRRCGAVTPSTRLVSNFAMKWVVSFVISRPFGPDDVSRGPREGAFRRAAPLRRRHAIDATRLHLLMKWVVSFVISRPFGPDDVSRGPREGAF